MNYLKFQEILQQFSEHERFLILIHEKPDGDAMGSGTALALFLTALGKTSAVLVPTSIPERLSFVKHEKVTYFEGKDAFLQSGYAYDFAVSVDVASSELIAAVLPLPNGEIDLAIDHHRVNTLSAKDKYVDETAAAAGEILFQIFSMFAMITHKEVFDTALCEALFTSISSDTGCFKYGNTTSQSHDIAAKLLSMNIGAERINRLLFDTKTKAQIAAEKLAYEKLTYYFDGKLALIPIDLQDLEEIGAAEEDTDTFSQLARMIDGVEIGVLMREKVFPDGTVGYKFSVRANSDVDVSALCGMFGGGGHKKAAGCTIKADAVTAKELFLKQAEDFVS